MNRGRLNKENSSSSNGNHDQGRNSCFSSSNRENESELTKIKKFQDTIATLTQKLESAEQRNSNLEHAYHVKSKEIKNLQTQFAILGKREADHAQEILELKENISNLESIPGSLIEMRKLIEAVRSMEASMRVTLACNDENIKKKFNSFQKLVLGKLGVLQKVHLELEQVVRGRQAAPTPHPTPRPIPTLIPLQPASMYNLEESDSGSDVDLQPRLSPPPDMVPAQPCVTSQTNLAQPQPNPIQTRSSPQPGPSGGHQNYSAQATSSSGQPTWNIGSRSRSSILLQRNGLGSPYHVALHSDHNITLPECGKCGKIFLSWRARNQHIEKTINCRTQPSNSFMAIRGKGIQHGIVSHDKNTDSFTCLCNRNLPRSRFHFTKHYLYHNAECLFYCGFCVKRFLYRSRLEAHCKTKMHGTNLVIWDVNCSRLRRSRSQV